jgi:hypothetical protein
LEDDKSASIHTMLDRENDVAGIYLDTTFTMIRGSVMVVVSHVNVNHVTFAFSFDVTESFVPYNWNLLKVRLSKRSFPIRGIPHSFCLRHVLTNQFETRVFLQVGDSLDII